MVQSRNFSFCGLSTAGRTRQSTWVVKGIQMLNVNLMLFWTIASYSLLVYTSSRTCCTVKIAQTITVGCVFCYLQLKHIFFHLYASFMRFVVETVIRVTDSEPNNATCIRRHLRRRLLFLLEPNEMADGWSYWSPLSHQGWNSQGLILHSLYRWLRRVTQP